ncbi:hypothetical protein XI04_27540 [Bradyrhizobium sp. CCBAU 11430]|nr:hypothetical protein [Bradyrhizobium sp. CCBAU 25360]MDA9516767.1 hypothetical protein [Bradyrhizobium sp. CCBAU 11430]
MPLRTRKNRRRKHANISLEAVALFRRGLATSDPAQLRDLRIALAAALGRGKFSANPLDIEPRSLIGCDRVLSRWCWS